MSIVILIDSCKGDERSIASLFIAHLQQLISAWITPSDNPRMIMLFEPVYTAPSANIFACGSTVVSTVKKFSSSVLNHVHGSDGLCQGKRFHVHQDMGRIPSSG